MYDSGDYGRALEEAVRDGDLAELRRRRDAARAQGRLYGIGYAAAVEPSVSNMGYITAALTPAERARAGPKNGAQSTATVTLDPVGAVTVQVASVPQGQGHRTVLAQVVADVFGLRATDVRVIVDLDTAKDAWSIASGNYSSRFAAAVAGVAHLAATRLREKLARIAAAQMNLKAEDIVFADGRVASRTNPDAFLPFARVAATSHWAPGLLPDGVDAAIRETAFWTPPQLTAPDEADHVASSLCHGFIFDFCGVAVDRATGKLTVDRYVTMHDCGVVLHSGMVEGQVRGGFAQALGAAVFEELSYGDDGAFLSGTLADYLLPTATEVPDIRILHMETPSPFTPLGAKGVGEGNCMSTPVCLANAVADALGLDAVDLPLAPAKLAALVAGGDEPAPPAGRPNTPAAAGKPGDRTLRGSGEATVKATPEAIWAMLLDPDVLASVIPGAHGVKKVSDTRFTADVTLGIGPVKGRYAADIALSDLDANRGATLTGTVAGALGSGSGSGRVTLERASDGVTRVGYTYEAAVGGKVASVGGRLLDGAARVIIGGFFTALARRAEGKDTQRGGLPPSHCVSARGAPVKPPAFDFVRAESVEEALGVLGEAGGDARILAGGQSLMPMLNMRLTRPTVLIDIMRLAALGTPRVAQGRLVVPAAVRQGALLARPSLAAEVPLLAEALPWVGHVQTRARGTLCGSVAHADPSAEIALCLVALEGQVRLRSRKRARTVAADAFFSGTMFTVRSEDEMVESISFPTRAPGSGYAFAEVARRHGDYAIAACAAVVDDKRMRLAVGGVADRPVVRDLPMLNGSALDDALNAFAWDLQAGDDIHATARYRRDLVRTVGRGTLERAARCRG